MNEQDSLALVDLFNNTNGSSWVNNSNWLSSETTVDQWFGVTVDNNRITLLQLPDNNLRGQLPSSIGSMTELFYLMLGGNSLNGSIPETITDITALETLYLQTNQLSGNIPENIGNLSNLHSLMLAENSLTGSIPVSIGDLINLEYLELDANQIDGSIPGSICNLANLNVLSLGQNSITGSIPGNIGDLVALEMLRLEANQISGQLPQSISNLTNLSAFILGGNQFVGEVPDVFNSMSNLENISLEYNRFTSLPNLSNIQSLSELQVSSNNLQFDDLEPNYDIFTAPYQYTPQDSVGIAYDTLALFNSTLVLAADVGGDFNSYQWKKNGTILPGAVHDTYIINSFNESDAGFYSCDITNTLVDGLTLHKRPMSLRVEWSDRQLDSLALVSLFDSTNGTNWTNNTNWLTQTPISQWYGVTVEGDRVVSIHLENNALIGQLPSALFDLQDLTILQLGYNQLSGEIPENMGNCGSLRELFLYYNQFTGTIPESVVSLVDLRVLMLHANNFSGPLPGYICDLSNLTNLWLYNNQFNGSIPDSIGKLTNLRDFSLNLNEMTGSIPTGIGNMTNLNTLHLNSNQFTGTIPESFYNLVNLRQVWLDGNQLSGDLTSNISNLNSLTDLRLMNNNLSGELPENMGALTELHSIYFNDNNFTGRIPNSLGDLPSLRFIQFSENQLYGTIPASFSDATYLDGFDISGNELFCDGQVPSFVIDNGINIYGIEDQTCSPLWYRSIPDTSIVIGDTVLISFDYLSTFCNPDSFLSFSIVENSGVGWHEQLETLSLFTIEPVIDSILTIEIVGSNTLYADTTEMRFQVIRPGATIISVEDIANDQGGWVRVDFTTLLYGDHSGTSYTIMREDGDTWISLHTLDEVGLPRYVTEARTLTDSSATHSGMTNFKVLTSMGNKIFESPIIGGYSVDNIAPATPGGLLANISNSNIRLDWQSPIDSDFMVFRIYQGSEQYFDISDSIVFAETINNYFTDELPSVGQRYYRISAIDIHNNESLPTASIGVQADTLESIELPSTHVLNQNFPNPFNPNTTLMYGLPEDTGVSLIIYDIRGIQVRTIASGTQLAGWYEYVWSGVDDFDQPVSTGLYLARLQAGSYSKVIKMLYLQ